MAKTTLEMKSDVYNYSTKNKKKTNSNGTSSSSSTTYSYNPTQARTTGGGGVNKYTYNPPKARTTGGGGVNTYEYNPPRARTTGGGGNNSIDGYSLDKSGTWQENKSEVEVPSITYTTETQEPVNRALNEFSMSSSKSARYRDIASNLATLSADYAKQAGRVQGGFNIFNGIMAGVNSVASAINPWVGAATTAVTAIANLFNNSGKKQEESANYAQMQQNMVSYLTNLTNRDTTIMNTMDSIYSSMDNMRGTYGSSFVDQMYNYYLAQSGMTSDAYSMLTGNFTNFELGNGQYGNQSAEGGIFDTLTDGNQGVFNNIYAQLQMGDLSSNGTLMNSLVQSLYGANTEFGLSMRGYENELRTALQQSALQQSQYMFGARSDLASIGTNGRSDNISATESIGSAEADQATSGLRGGTTANNANLARLQRDLGVIQRTAQTASVIGSLKYNIQNAQLNASSTAFSNRQAQRKAVVGALNSTIATWNSIGRTVQSGERQSNYYIDEAKSNQRQFEEGFNNIRNDADKDKFLEAASN